MPVSGKSPPGPAGALRGGAFCVMLGKRRARKGPERGVDAVYFTEYESPLGRLTLAGEERELTGLWLEGQKYFGATLAPGALRRDNLASFVLARDWLDRYFSGERPEGRELPLSPKGTPFQRLIWSLLLDIPWGETVTYGELARRSAVRLGRKSMSAQAVGGAVGRNPIAIIIPCHRVVGTGGNLTGYAGGLERKDWLLRWEGRNQDSCRICEKN